MEQTVFDTKPLYRPHQVEEAKNTIAVLQETLADKHASDRATAARQLRRITDEYNKQVPQPPSSVDEEGRMVHRSDQLLDDILQGMPSQEEMRKAPPGAVTKHMKWEKRNKLKILEWKNLQLRMTHGEDPEAANLEKHRPVGSSLSMDNAFIPGKQFYLPPVGAARSVAFSDEQLAYLRSVAPDIADGIGLMGNEQRAKVKGVLDDGIGTEKTAKVKKSEVKPEKKQRKPLSEERRAQLRDQLARGRAAAAAKKGG